MANSPFPEGTPDFVAEAVADAFAIAETKMADSKLDANFARGYFMACVDLRESLTATALNSEYEREKRRKAAVEAHQKEKSGEPS